MGGGNKGNRGGGPPKDWAKSNPRYQTGPKLSKHGRRKALIRANRNAKANEGSGPEPRNGSWPKVYCGNLPWTYKSLTEEDSTRNGVEVKPTNRKMRQRISRNRRAAMAVVVGVSKP